MKKNEFSNFVGIDVSKKTLDAVFIFNQEINTMVHHQFSNDEKGIKKIFGFVKKQKGVNAQNTIFCYEHTGIYGRKLSYTLVEKQWCVWIEMPVAILRSMGLQRGKNDKVDAKRIAIYAMKNYENAKLWEAPRKEIGRLRQMLTTREALLNGLKALKMPIKLITLSVNMNLIRGRSLYLALPVRGPENNDFQNTTTLDGRCIS